MPALSSPTVKRRRLAAELRRYRDLAGLTIEDVAQQLEWSSAKISRIENARVSVLPRDVKFLLRTYRLSDQDEAWDLLLTLARESRQKGWWQQYGEAVPDWFEVFVGLEAGATTIWGYDAEFVPGILQTEEYARTVHRAQLIKATDGEIDRLVRVRLARQELLTSDGGPQLWLVLNEAVIRRVVGGAAIMREQLKRLIEASRLPNMALQIVPFGQGAHPAMDGSFNLLGFPEPTDPNIVYIEYHTGALYLEKTAEVNRYSLMFDHLRAAALPVDDSRRLMARVAEDLT
ncbi:MAG TPA: helix-turn-helix transcriptional regulator [Streptosporangiaceae bacterium]|nr:helix-turn-helix transcriptional regulator [Streptosporangiaceae bacterium]